MPQKYESKQFKVDHPAPHGWIQWKGTDVCIDIKCECGALLHHDGDFMYFVRCPACKAVYECDGHIQLHKVSAEELPLVIAESLHNRGVDMSDHQYGPHSSGNLISDGTNARPYETSASNTVTTKHAPLLYTQAQVDALLRREIEHEREAWRSRLENAALQIESLRVQADALIDSIVDGRAFLPSPPMIIQGFTQSQVDALVKAETERCDKIAEGQDSGCDGVEDHVAATIAAFIREDK